MVHSMVRRSTDVNNVFVGSYVKLKSVDVDCYIWLLINRIKDNFCYGVVSNLKCPDGYGITNSCNSEINIGILMKLNLSNFEILDIYNDLLD